MYLVTSLGRVVAAFDNDEHAVRFARIERHERPEVRVWLGGELVWDGNSSTDLSREISCRKTATGS